MPIHYKAALLLLCATAMLSAVVEAQQKKLTPDYEKKRAAINVARQIVAHDINHRFMEAQAPKENRFAALRRMDGAGQSSEARSFSSSSSASVFGSDACCQFAGYDSTLTSPATGSPAAVR